MNRSGLYEKLSMIIDTYPSDYRINTYNHPEMKKVFNAEYTQIRQSFHCFSPEIQLSRVDNKIRINFKGSYPHYPDNKHEDYTIDVFQNGRVTNNVAFKRRFLLSIILDYLEGDVYSKAQSIQNQRMKERRLEMNKDPNINKYTDMSKDILCTLGKTYFVDGYKDDWYEECSYTGYGLSITATDLPPIEYYKNNRLDSMIKKYMKKITIQYKGETVFDSMHYSYTKGIWEKILVELYNKLDVFNREIENKIEINRHCAQLLYKVIMPLYSEHVRQINNSITINYGSEDGYIMDRDLDYDKDYYYSVIKDGETVLSARRVDYTSIAVSKYIPGSWEQELTDYLKDLNIRLQKEKEQKDYNEGMEYLNQLKRLR